MVHPRMGKLPAHHLGTGPQIINVHQLRLDPVQGDRPPGPQAAMALVEETEAEFTVIETTGWLIDSSAPYILWFRHVHGLPRQGAHGHG